MTKDFESLLFISQILTDTSLDEMSQLKAIKKVMLSWIRNLKLIRDISNDENS